MSFLRRFPSRPGYQESLELKYDSFRDRFSVKWYLYDEYYPGFEDHEYVIELIPGQKLRDVLGAERNSAVHSYLRKFFKNNISSERFIRFLNMFGIPYSEKPDDEWVPGVDEGEPFPITPATRTVE